MTTLQAEPQAPEAGAVRPVTMPVVDRVASAVVTAVPPVILLIGMIFGWTSHLLVWQDLLILAVMYCGVGTGITVGFHRLLTHRSFKCNRWLRAGFAALGSAAAEGPVIDWVATHRKHHQFSDIEGDPHSPHVGHGHGWRGALSGLAHAHIGWVFSDMEVADERRYAKDLLADPLIKFVDRTFVLWVVLGLAVPFGLGAALSGTVTGALTALLWGGAARIFLMHHATFSINSLCHFFGKQDYDTADESRNLAWLAIPTWGEAWHNNHHAFPTSYR
ncbi:MAG: acyl-CoA desaturase, partial [Catenulispora sp.]